MTTLGRRSRRDALDAALDRVVAGLPVAPDGSNAHLVAAAGSVRRGLVTEPSADAREAHLAALLATAREVASSPATTAPPPAPMRTRSPRRQRVVAVALAATVSVMLMSASAMAAASTAVPGDTLYGFKVAGERIALAVPRSAEAQAQLDLSFAQRRLAELEVVLARGDSRHRDALLAAFSRHIDRMEQKLTTTPSPSADALGHAVGMMRRHVGKLLAIQEKHVGSPAEPAIKRTVERAKQRQARIEEKHRRATGRRGNSNGGGSRGSSTGGDRPGNGTGNGGGSNGGGNGNGNATGR